ncbi:radical SAM protein [Desulfoluna spongiiphila]|uniref:radical SAM protein n=1 Tax=Desulfoluna spongiiphila TaxID=419481 RepID=UPI00125ADB33|nr:hypothetical protein [Desulfoluna spongiiphila]VVS94522.1 radical sam alpha/beta horseshoe [Desulfoluna spongiiphila]
MSTLQIPVPTPPRNMIPEDTPVDAFTRFFRKAKSLGCFPHATDTSPSCAFSVEETPPYAAGSQAPVTGHRARALWNTLIDTPLDQSLAATICVPFGASGPLDKGTDAIPTGDALSAAYADAVICDIMRDGARIRQQGNPIHALVVNGETPTALTARDLARIIEAARRNLSLANDCEITVEGRIADMTPERIRTLTRAGVNRFSLSLLSFQTPLRQAAGRRSDGEHAANTLSDLIETGQVTVNVGLTYGLPDQTAASFRKDMETLVAMKPDGIDLVPHAPIHTHGPDQYALFEEGTAVMAATTCRRISAGHWACTPRERNLSALLAGRQTPCLPFGCGAEGLVEGHRVLVTDRLEDYLSTAGREKPVAMVLPPTDNHRLAHVVTSQMQTLALDLAGLGRSFGDSLPMALLPLLHCWVNARLVRIEGHILRPTTAGEYWHATLTHGLIDYLSLYTEMGCPEPCV